jgi:hypothetical protein
MVDTKKRIVRLLSHDPVKCSLLGAGQHQRSGSTSFPSQLCRDIKRAVLARERVPRFGEKPAAGHALARGSDWRTLG